MNVKLFTLEGVIVTVIHDLIILGLLSGWIFFQVQVMGNDVNLGNNTRASQSRR